MNRAEILDYANKAVIDRGVQDYGKPENSFDTISRLWEVYLDAAHPELNLSGVAEAMEVNRIITPKDAAVMMALLKVARITAGDKADNFIDLAGYAACAGEIATRTKEGRVEVNLTETERFRALAKALEDDRK